MTLNFAAIDVETANSHRGSVCSFGVVIVRNGQVTEKHHLLTVPPGELNYFDQFNTLLHGIGPSDIAGQPTFAARLTEVLTLIGDLPVVAHNAGFDFGAIRQACDEANLDWPTLTYGCSAVMSRRAGLTLLSYRLSVVCAALNITQGVHHRADDDAEAAANIVIALAARTSTATLELLATSLMVRLGALTPLDWSGCTRKPTSGPGGKSLVAPDANPLADPDHALFGRFIVFTGTLSLRREDAYALVANLGASPQTSLTKKTHFLVIGDGFTGHNAADFTTGKAKKAALVNAAGGNVEILTEGDLIELLNETLTVGSRPSLEAREAASLDRQTERSNATQVLGVIVD